jgi:hypothetical protein
MAHFTGRLGQAVAAYRDALQEYTRDRMPQLWSATEEDLGYALFNRGDFASAAIELEKVVGDGFMSLAPAQVFRTPAAIWNAAQKA